MARIEWVKQRLDNWARWVTQRSVGWSGFPKQSAFMREARSAQSTESMMVPVDDIEASRTHQVVEGMRTSHGGLWLVVQCYYVGDPQAQANRRRPMACSEIAERMCITARAVQARMEDADMRISVGLHEAEACHERAMGWG